MGLGRSIRHALRGDKIPKLHFTPLVMPTSLASIDLIQVTQGLLVAMLISGIITTLAFIFKWGPRFRMVGITSFTGVLAGSVFGVAVGFNPHIAVPGALRYQMVYDSGGSEVVISIPALPVGGTIDAPTVNATLQDAALNLFSPGRYGKPGETQMLIRLRVLKHLDTGATEPIFVGEARRSLSSREDPSPQITVDPKAIARLAV
jgi:hypothetical protein